MGGTHLSEIYGSTPPPSPPGRRRLSILLESAMSQVYRMVKVKRWIHLFSDDREPEMPVR